MLYDLLAAPFVDYQFMRRALVGALALVIGWSGTHICAWPIRRRWRERRAMRRATTSNHFT